MTPGMEFRRMFHEIPPARFERVEQMVLGVAARFSGHLPKAGLCSGPPRRRIAATANGSSRSESGMNWQF